MNLPLPPKWNPVTDDIDSNDVVRQAQDYERSLLRRGVVFPRRGEIWELVRDAEVNFIAFVPKTILPGGRTRLQQGEKVRIITDEAKPIHVNFQPVRYHELHPTIVPQEIRDRPGYQYYWLSLRIARTTCCLSEEPGFFDELFTRVADT